ncbi:hypothetical protein F2P81_006083 [Scophthalmus maximus]|uniref:Uncharacterized protein n=1 Tax=Scophthalmus maximus TaxID=52904 RepID=A0A6A4TI78_SCOMX|nr:hypothetical protein F2P81_006083 [Scophthalmus maximus]
MRDRENTELVVFPSAETSWSAKQDFRPRGCRGRVHGTQSCQFSANCQITEVPRFSFRSCGEYDKVVKAGLLVNLIFADTPRYEKTAKWLKNLNSTKRRIWLRERLEFSKDFVFQPLSGRFDRDAINPTGRENDAGAKPVVDVHVVEVMKGSVRAMRHHSAGTVADVRGLWSRPSREVGVHQTTSGAAYSLRVIKSVQWLLAALNHQALGALFVWLEL